MTNTHLHFIRMVYFQCFETDRSAGSNFTTKHIEGMSLSALSGKKTDASSQTSACTVHTFEKDVENMIQHLLNKGSLPQLEYTSFHRPNKTRWKKLSTSS